MPVDLTDRHQAALETAAGLVAPGGQGTLPHVIEVIHGLPMEEEKGFYGKLERAARKHLDRLGAELERRKVAWRAEVLYGQRGAEVIRYAGSQGSDLIVVTSP